MSAPNCDWDQQAPELRCQLTRFTLQHALLVPDSDPTEQPRRRLPLFEGCSGLVV
jgi:hypothetical protein